jgi:hypothetical protein
VVVIAPSAISRIEAKPNFQIETPNAPISSVINEPLERYATTTSMTLKKIPLCKSKRIPDSIVQKTSKTPIATKKRADAIKSGWRWVGRIPRSGRTGIWSL